MRTGSESNRTASTCIVGRGLKRGIAWAGMHLGVSTGSGGVISRAEAVTSMCQWIKQSAHAPESILHPACHLHAPPSKLQTLVPPQ
jgi:hypothetical protein